MILRLAYRDVLHDRLLSACLVLAIASIIAPLLILFGLQFGTIETLRHRLVQDPKNREIRPMTTKSYERDWFASFKTENPEVAFIIPMTRQIAASIMAINAAADARESLSLLATAPGDPLLLENGGAIPGQGECVLTAAAAAALKVKVGDQLEFSAQRIVQGRYENAPMRVVVKGILDERASGLKTAFVSLDLIEAVEDFKDGRAVPAYGWQGELPLAYAVFDGAVVLVPEPLSKLDEVLLVNNTGFAQIQAVSADQLPSLLGTTPAGQWTAYHLRVKQHPANEINLRAVESKLRGREARVFPWIDPLPVSLRAMDMAASPAAPVTLHLSVLPFTPMGEQEPHSSGEAAKRIIHIPAELPLEGAAMVSVRMAEREVHVPVTLRHAEVPTGRAFAAADLAGSLDLLRFRAVRYDESADTLLLSRQGYAGFRLYAASIDAVAPMQQRLENAGIPVNTELERIAEVRRLDHYTRLIFWLVAAVGVVGGISALTASLYASVERKKRELNVLRLLGVLKQELVLFPVAQGLMLSSGALLLSVFIFAMVAGLINQLFRTQLRTEESLCTLSLGHFVVLFAGVWLLSVIAATFAALRATRFDPAEALRDE